MLVAGIIVIVLLVAFAGVLLVGAPYLPTLRSQTETALDLLDLRPGQTLLELGSGDGRVLIAAAQRGWQVVGIELNLLLVIISWLRTRRYRKQVRIVWGDFWRVQWPECDGVFTFLLDRFMVRLDVRMQTLHRPLASVAFKIPGRKPADHRDGVYLYEYKK
jgi:hypothetical protein